MERNDIHNEFGSGRVGNLTQAGVINNIANYQNGLPGGAQQLGPWAQKVWDSEVWHKVPAQHNVEPYKQGAAIVAAQLQVRHEHAQRMLVADPWRDPGYGLRFLEQAEKYLPPDLYPAEAALLLLVPLIHHVHQAETAVWWHRAVDPTNLEQDPSATGDRLSYQRTLGDYGTLLGRVPRRPEGREPIGWWLYHRWLRVHCGVALDKTFPELVDQIVPTGSVLKDALDPARLRKLLYGLQRGPEVCSTEHLDELKPEQSLRGSGRQLVRERRLALLLALANGMAIELTALPDIIVDHVGIPEAVEPEQLRETLDQFSWGGSDVLPVLSAVYHHGAVEQALEEHIARLDEMLHGIQRAIPDRVTSAMPELPRRLSTTDVQASDSKIVNWAKFRLDERRVRDMLMGTQLYKDRNLAVRELYQNALDACRYRRARTDYLRAEGHPLQEYEGSITFIQGEDEDGRPYLECEDDGVGMGEAQLRGVFSQAGARFADQPAYKAEEALWAGKKPPIKLFPNSRSASGCSATSCWPTRSGSPRAGWTGGRGRRERSLWPRSTGRVTFSRSPWPSRGRNPSPGCGYTSGRRQSGSRPGRVWTCSVRCSASRSSPPRRSREAGSRSGSEAFSTTHDWSAIRSGPRLGLRLRATWTCSGATAMAS
ncbi:hypothetical protein ATKI12_3112 [Kitasatospora sp. Ki12]